MEWLLNLIPFFGNFISQLITNKQNQSLQAAANQTNIQLAREQNASSANQAQLAYIRNNPAAQIQQLQNVGFSRNGAAALLSGSPGYSAAPVSSATTQSARLQAPQFDNNLASSAMQGRQQSKQLELIDQQMRQNELEEQRKAELHIEQLKAAKRQNVTSKYEQDSRDKADALFELLKSHISSDTNYKDVSDLVKRAGLQDSKEWKETNTTSYNMVQDLIKSYQQTSLGSANNVITWNKANRQEFYNAIEDLDYSLKRLNEKKFKFEVEKMPEMYELQKALQSANLRKLLQEIDIQYARESRDLESHELDMLAKKYDVDIKRLDTLVYQAKNSPYFEKFETIKGGDLIARECIKLIDTASVLLSPLKGILSF